MRARSKWGQPVKVIARVHESWSELDPQAWDTLVGGGSPFVEHAWLWGLESSGAACPATGWQPRPITLEADGQLVAGAPAWIVSHERGQFVYQGHWSRAAHEAGISIEPKLLVGVPFTPVTGSRLLTHPSADPALKRAILRAIGEVSHDLEAWHLFFPDEAEATLATGAGAFVRTQYQYHWRNRAYRDFDHFLERFRSKRRKAIRRERASLRDLRFEVVSSPTPAQMEILWRAYDATVRHYDDTDRFLNRAFFEHLQAHLGERLRIFLAWRGAEPVGASLCICKGNRLYGRYAGQIQRISNLHFELCYYQGVEHCIAEGLEVYEPGHGGDHKYARGFEPELTFSAHRFRHPGAQQGFARSALDEQRWVKLKIASLNRDSPLKPLPEAQQAPPEAHEGEGADSV